MNTSASTKLSALLPSDAAAALLGLKPQTLRAWRLRGVGPTYVRVGTGRRGRVFYREEDLVAWLTPRRFGSTAEETAAAPPTREQRQRSAAGSRE